MALHFFTNEAHCPQRLTVSFQKRAPHGRHPITPRGANRLGFASSFCEGPAMHLALIEAGKGTPMKKASCNGFGIAMTTAIAGCGQKEAVRDVSERNVAKQAAANDSS